MAWETNMKKNTLADVIVNSRPYQSFIRWLRAKADKARQARIAAAWDAGFFEYGDAKVSRAACVNAMWMEAAHELVEKGAAEWDGPQITPKGTAFLDQFKACGLKHTPEEMEMAGYVLQGKFGKIRITQLGVEMVQKMKSTGDAT